MARYIDAELIKYGTYEYAPYQKIDIATKDSINRIPTADVAEVKHGHWVRWYVAVEHDIGKEYIPHCKCSECEEEFEPHATRFMKFCSNCGAKIDEEVNNDKGV